MSHDLCTFLCGPTSQPSSAILPQPNLPLQIFTPFSSFLPSANSAHSKQDEERLLMVEQKRKMEEERRALEKAQKKAVKAQQDVILNRKGNRARLSFSVTPKAE